MDINQLKQDILKCRACETLFGFEPHPVFLGHEHSKIMQISQAPSKRVHETLKPFNDASGKRLKQEWYQIQDHEFYNPDYFYIVSMAHCYPGRNKHGNDHHPPKQCYKRWVEKEITAIQNQIYIIIGAQAAGVLLPNVPFQDLVFHNQILHGKPAFVLPHPSPLNFRWLQEHPEFLEKRIIEIRAVIKDVLKIS